MAEKLPFTFTPNIVRYLKEIIEVYEKHAQGVPKDIPIPPLVHVVYAYYPDETFYSFSEQNRLAFVEYVSRNEAVEMHDNDEGENWVLADRSEFWPDENDESPDMAKAFGTHPWEIQVIVYDIKPIFSLWNQYLRQKSTDKVGREEIQVEQVSFNDADARLTYRNKSYTLHKGKGKKPLRLRLFEKLWEERMHVVNDMTTKTGKLMTLTELTNRLGSGPGKSDIYNLESALQRKHMPIRIEKVGDSIRLVVSEHI